jgi:adenylate cyclase
MPKVRRRGVREKLAMLVATPTVMMVVALPVLYWLLNRQVTAGIDRRVEGAAESFEQELRDDLDDVALSAKVIAADGDTRRSVQAKDGRRAGQLARVFHQVYPNLAVLLARADGEVVAQVGCALPLSRLQEVEDLKKPLRSEAYRGLVEHGCEAGAGAPAAYTIALPVLDGGKVAGAVVVCMPIDAVHLANTSAKLGFELGLVGPPPASGLLDHTEGFPGADIAGLDRRAKVIASGGRTFAMALFQPPELRTSRGAQMRVVAALDITHVRGVVSRHLLYALGVLALATLLAVAFGARLAGVMSRAIHRVSDAMKRLEHQEYAHVEGVQTGDELEALARGFNVMVDGLRERDKLRTTLGKYMTASVMEHLLRGEVELGGETLTVTILFADIRSFSTLSEKMDAQSLVALLNEYFTEMVGAVTSEDGVVDKYIGDGIMVVFGAPVTKPDDAVRAARAAVKMRRGLVALNARLAARGIPPLAAGIGIHTGEVVAGNIGSEQRMEYTVIGDAVNLASRLESATKELGTPVLMSADTWALVKGKIEARPVREIKVKGRVQPVMTYEIVGITGEAELPFPKR